MIGGWMRLAQWAREIERKREERAEQRESLKKRRLKSGHAGGQELRHIELTADEKEMLRAKITGREQKTTRGSKMKIAVCLYMAIMALGVVGFAFIIYIRESIDALESMVSCLIAIAFCVLWLKLSNIREGRSLAVTIPGIILFVLGSGIAGFGVVPLHLESVILSRILGIPVLIASYILCFSKDENAESYR